MSHETQMDQVGYQDGWDEGWRLGNARFTEYQEAMLPLLEVLGLSDALVDSPFAIFPQPQPGHCWVEWQRLRRDEAGQVIWDGDRGARETVLSYITIDSHCLATP